MRSFGEGLSTRRRFCALHIGACVVGLSWWLDDKESSCNAGNLGSIPGSGKSLGGGRGNPHQYCCLGNPTDRGARRARVHGVTKSQTQMSMHIFVVSPRPEAPASPPSC